MSECFLLFVYYFTSKTFPFLSLCSTIHQSICTRHGGNTEVAFPWSTRGCPQSSPVLFSNRCHISTFLWRSHAMRVGEGEERKRLRTKEWAGLLLTDSRLKSHPITTIQEHIMHKGNLDAHHILLIPVEYAYNRCTPRSTRILPSTSRLSLVDNKESHLRWIYSIFHGETSHCAFTFRMKGSIKFVRWAHYDLVVLNKSHQSHGRGGVGWLQGG